MYLVESTYQIITKYKTDTPISIYFYYLVNSNVQLANKIHVHARVQWEDILEEKTNVFIKSPHLKPSKQGFQRSQVE